jgi:secreted trypsin-like serine protease
MNTMLFLSILSVAISAWAFQQTIPKSEDGGHIYNGSIYDKDKYPYLVAIDIHPGDDLFVCTGIMITLLFVLTATYCTYGRKASDIQVNMINFKFE